TSICFCKLACQYVGGHHRNGRTLPRHQRHAKSSVAQKSNSTPRPTLHFDLAHSIKIQVRRTSQFIKNNWTLPSPIAQACSYHVFSCCKIRGRAECPPVPKNK